MCDKNIIKSKLTVERYPYNSVIELVADRLGTDSDKGCLIDCTLNRRWTKREVLDSSLNFAYYLVKEFDVKKGDIILFVKSNTDCHAIAIFGVLAAGAVYASLPDHSTEVEIRNAVETIRPTIVICSSENFGIIDNSLNQYCFIKPQLLVIDDRSERENRLTFETILGNEREADLILPRSTLPDDVIMIVLSSGSTGQPKAIIKTNLNLLANSESAQHKEISPLNDKDIFLSNGFCHSTGPAILLHCIISGAQLAIIRMEENHTNALEAIHNYGITTAILMATELNFLSRNSQKYNKTYLKSLRNVLAAGSVLSNDTYNSIKEQFNFEMFKKAYGMSEVGGILTVYNSDVKNIRNVNTVGKLRAGNQAKVIDEIGKALGPNEHGQLCFKGDMVSPGYLNNDKENSKLFTEDGFLKTGDLAYYDENEFFYIEGRYKDIIKVEGVVVSPVELENILLQNKEIENAAVIGIEDQEYGEIPLAFVKLIKRSTLTADQIRESVDNQVNYYKKLRGGVRIIDKFPLTSLGKINKQKLKEMILQNN